MIFQQSFIALTRRHWKDFLWGLSGL